MIAVKEVCTNLKERHIADKALEAPRSISLEISVIYILP